MELPCFKSQWLPESQDQVQGRVCGTPLLSVALSLLYPASLLRDFGDRGLCPSSLWGTVPPHSLWLFPTSVSTTPTSKNGGLEWPKSHNPVTPELLVLGWRAVGRVLPQHDHPGTWTLAPPLPCVPIQVLPTGQVGSCATEQCPCPCHAPGGPGVALATRWSCFQHTSCQPPSALDPFPQQAGWFLK